jgi:hypothetical protein
MRRKSSLVVRVVLVEMRDLSIVDHMAQRERDELLEWNKTEGERELGLASLKLGERT